MTLFKTDRPRAIDRVIDYFGESRRIFAGSSTPPPAAPGTRLVAGPKTRQAQPR
jgi:hypothetical protein